MNLLDIVQISRGKQSLEQIAIKRGTDTDSSAELDKSEIFHVNKCAHDKIRLFTRFCTFSVNTTHSNETNWARMGVISDVTRITELNSLN